MDCIGSGSTAVTERPDLTAQGYHRFRCRDCGKQFNERSDGVLNRASLPSDIIAFVVFCRLRYRLTLRDLSEILLLRGFTVSHERVRQWEAKLLPVMGEALRKRRHGTGRRSGQSWYVDETYLKVHGRWCYLYRAIDRDGNLIDTDLIGLFRDLDLSQNEALACREGRDHVDRRVDTLFLTGPPQRLAVDGDHPLWRSGQRRNPGDEAALELLGVEDPQDVAQMVVCVSERPEAAQKSELLAAEQSDIDERLGPSRYRRAGRAGGSHRADGSPCLAGEGHADPCNHSEKSTSRRMPHDPSSRLPWLPPVSESRGPIDINSVTLLGCHLLLHPIALQVLDRALDLQAQSGRIVPQGVG